MERTFCNIVTGALVCYLLVVVCHGKGDEGKPNFRTLRLVQVIMRHGQRNQIRTYPLDPYRDEDRYWPAGFGQLTETGVEETYELGQYIRSRYDELLNATYNQYEVLAQSSSVERAIRSALSALKGVYPPIRDESNNFDGDPASGKDCVNTTSQVVPVRTISTDQDDFIHMDRPCPAYKREHNRFLREAGESRRMQSEHSDLIRIINKNAGVNATDIYEEDIGYTLDALNAQRLQGTQLPTWVTEDIIHLIDRFMPWYLGGETGTPLLKQLRSGVVDKVLTNMKEKVSGNAYKPRRKFILMSGHDRTVITFLNLIGAYNQLPVPYAGAVFVELHSDIRYNDHHIEIYYRNDTMRAPYKLQPSFCGTPCFLNEFRLFAAELVPINWEKACEVPNSASLLQVFSALWVLAMFSHTLL